jgi:DNA modification methylase
MSASQDSGNACVSQSKAAAASDQPTALSPPGAAPGAIGFRRPAENHAENHPLAVRRTELVWEGKYDRDGRRVAPLRVALPFQTIETVNESAQERQKMMLFESPGAYGTEGWRNRLIWGDKKYVLPSLLPELAGKVNLIYIDPPFDTGADFSFTATVPDQPGASEDDSFAFTKEPSIIEQKAYRDTWGRGLDSYLQWFYETVVMLHELLAENGSLYVHLDYHVSHYAKAVLDEVFGMDNFTNEIVWKRQTAHSDPKRYGPIHDTLFFYGKSQATKCNLQYAAYDQSYIDSHYSLRDSDGRRYQLGDLTARGPRPGLLYTFRGVNPPPGRVWTTLPDKMEQLYKSGKIVFTSSGMPRRKRYLDEMSGVPLQDVWTDVNPVNSQAVEATDYATQKPEALLDRIIKASSNEGDLVLDCFCGSGTTAAVAEKLKRRWVTCDLGRFAIHTARKRLLSIEGVRPFVVQNLGKYERQLWQTAEFDSHAKQSREENEEAALVSSRVMQSYVRFILELYHAKPVKGFTWLHGVKGGKMVHVGAVDAPVSTGDVTNLAVEFRKAIGTGVDAPETNGVDVLGWDFAFEINEVAKQQAAKANLKMRFLRIPRDVMDKRAVEQGDIHFFELAALAVEVKAAKRDVALKLTDFVIPPDDVPEEARRAVKHWSQWIDYWAVDWDNKSDTFHNEWQTFRTRQESALALETEHTYAEPGEYTVVVKVIDILGNDTTKSVRVKVR